ncbi:N-acetylmuramoyl-L-alanine amidase, partial [Citricoccus sp. CH26A]
MALRPVLRTCAVTTLAAALTAATAFPAIASPIVPPSAPDPARNAVGQQVASEVKGEEQQTLAVDGIDPEALQPADQDAMPSADPSARTSGTPAPEPSAEPTVGPSAGPSVEPSVEPSVAAESGQPTPQAAGTRSARVSQASVVSLASAVKAAPGKGRPTGQERDVVPVPEGIAAKATAETDAETAPEARELAGTALPAEDTEQVAALTAPAETIDFIVAGVTWEVQDADEVTEVSVRVREDGTWTDWSSLEIHDGDERPGADRTGTEPLVSTGADAVQARVSTVSGEVPKGLQVDIINPGVADTDGKLNPAPAGAPETGEPTADHASATASSTAEFVPAMHQQDGLITGTATGQTVATSADVLKPAIVTRAQWGANESVVQDWGRPSTRLKALYIHHTAGSNNYTKAGAYAQIRGIFTYHAVNLQWGDIGYQFLVDKFGTIYQGRRGSIDAPVPGAQAGGFNTDTIGVSAMGNYDVVAAPAAMVTAIERVLAWQAYRYDVDPKGTTRLTQSGKGTARWSSGTTVTVPTILGHKVTNFTACPGRYLDAQIPTIRRKVDAAVKAAVDQHGDVPSTPPPGEVRAEKQQWSRGRLSVWWTRPAGVVDQYEVMRRTAPAGTSDYGAWTTVKWIDASKYTSGIFDVEPGTTAHFAVRAHNAGGTSELITVATHTHVSVQAPGNVRPSKQQWSNGQLSVWWTRPARVDRYEVMRRSAPAGTSDYGAWTTVSWLDASKQTSGRFAVDQGTTAQFAVRAHNAGGTSELI